MVKYIARNIAVAWFFLTLFVIISLPNEYNRLGGGILGVVLIMYAHTILELDKLGL